MSARSILIALALSAWLVASVVAFLIVAYTSFFGMAFIGLVICYVSAQFELDGDRPVGSLATSFLGAQLRAQRDLPAEQRRLTRCPSLFQGVDRKERPARDQIRSQQSNIRAGHDGAKRGECCSRQATTVTERWRGKMAARQNELSEGGRRKSAALSSREHTNVAHHNGGGLILASDVATPLPSL